MRRWLILGLLATAGCDVVFPLAAPPTCGPKLAPGLDEDGDTVLNEDDVCPRVAYEPPDDEDADAIPDACDPCPQVAGDAGEDPDCDGIGSACDPDDAVVHERRFYGFETMRGFRFTGSDDGTLVAGQVQITLTSTNATAILVMEDPGARSATYEVAGSFRDLQPVYHALGIDVRDSTGYLYQVTIERMASGEVVLVLEHLDNEEIARRVLGTLAVTDVSFTLRADVTPGGFVAVATFGGLVGELVVSAADAPFADGPVTYGCSVIRPTQTAIPPTYAALDYYVYTTTLPQ